MTRGAALKPLAKIPTTSIDGARTDGRPACQPRQCQCVSAMSSGPDGCWHHSQAFPAQSKPSAARSRWRFPSPQPHRSLRTSRGTSRKKSSGANQSRDKTSSPVHESLQGRRTCSDQEFRGRPAGFSRQGRNGPYPFPRARPRSRRRLRGRKAAEDHRTVHQARHALTNHHLTCPAHLRAMGCRGVTDMRSSELRKGVEPVQIVDRLGVLVTSDPAAEIDFALAVMAGRLRHARIEGRTGAVAELLATAGAFVGRSLPSTTCRLPEATSTRHAPTGKR